MQFAKFYLGENYYAYYFGHRQENITVPWNYTYKLEAMNNTIREAMGDQATKLEFMKYLSDSWNYAMEHSDTQVKTATKPNRTPRG